MVYHNSPIHDQYQMTKHLSQSFLRNLFMVLQTLLKSMAKNFDDWVWHLSKIGEFCHIINQGPWWQMVSFTAGQKHQGAKNSWNVPDLIKFRFAKGFRAIFHYMTKLFNQDVKAGGKTFPLKPKCWLWLLWWSKSNKMRENIKVNHGRNQNKEGKRAIAQWFMLCKTRSKKPAAYIKGVA